MADGRVDNGGAREGSGRKSDAFRKERQKFLQKHVTDEDLKIIVDVAVAAAQSGNDKARKFIFDGIFGPEAQPVVIELVDEVAGLIREIAGYVAPATEAGEG